MKSKNFALNPDKDTLQQFDDCCKKDFVIKGALMPDAHKGYVAPIGAVLVTKDYIVPAWVGYDIGCGVSACEIKGTTLEKIRENEEKIYEEVKKNVPMGLGEIHSTKPPISKETEKEFKKIIEKFKHGPHKKQLLQFLESKAPRHLGTLGHGNHFIEIGYSEDKKPWIIVHSGSRGIGYKVAEFYMKKSAGNEKKFEETFPLHKDSELGKEYLNVLEFGLDFALLNRLEIIKKTIESIEKILGKKIEFELWTNKNHNHAIHEGEFFVHRKGATPAKKGERGVIPGNMKEGSFLVEGLGNTDFLESSSHGAGRIYSRKEAKEKFSMKEFEEKMNGIKGTISEDTLDESPMAYKNIYNVMKAQEQSVKIVKQIKPIINWKGEKHKKIN